jgi:5-methylcytosine-specific restriction endonuclease McrA
MPAPRRWLNPENEARNRFPSGWARYRQERPDLVALYTGQEWRVRRAEHLAANPTCVICGRKATHVDHVVNLASGGSFDGPLQSMCTPCHSVKTAKESHEGAKRAAARRKEK